MNFVHNTYMDSATQSKTSCLFSVVKGRKFNLDLKLTERRENFKTGNNFNL